MASWPGLANKLAAYVLEQVQTARQRDKAVESTLSTTMRRLITLADEEKRTGSTGMLSRRAGKLFRHVGDILDLAELSYSSQIGRDYSAILKHLLGEPTYCAAVKPGDWDFLVEKHLIWLRDAKAIASDDAIRVLGLLSSLLEQYPGEPRRLPDLLEDILNVLSGLAGTLEGNTLSRAGAAFFGVVNAFLVGSGVDVASRAAALHAVLHLPAMRALKGREVRLKERAVLYLRIQLTLGGVSQVQLQDLGKWAATEAEKMQWYVCFYYYIHFLALTNSILLLIYYTILITGK